MKFGKLLHTFQEEHDAPDCLLDYRSLKKQLKAFKSRQQGSTGEVDQAERQPPSPVCEEERQFIASLNEDVSRINSWFIEREEEAVIRVKALEDRMAAARTGKELAALGSALTDFHGEMVLLLHWSLVNYAAVAKILKKHDKLTGSLLRFPYLSNVLHQPFLSTESISRLVKQVEGMVAKLLEGQAMGHQQQGQEEGEQQSRQQDAPGGPGGEEAAADASGAVAPSLPQPQPHLVKRTRAALGLLAELQEKASTPSTLLPPGSALLKRPRLDAAAAGGGSDAAAGPAPQ